MATEHSERSTTEFNSQQSFDTSLVSSSLYQSLCSSFMIETEALLVPSGTGSYSSKQLPKAFMATASTGIIKRHIEESAISKK